MSKFIDLTGRKFERLTVIERCGRSKDGCALWLCVCDCGNEKIARHDALKKGDTKSCGCLNSELASARGIKRQKHGMAHKRIYNIWKRMKQRCLNPNDKDFHSYGGRGITVCYEWKDDFQAFYEWAMSNGYADNLTIDRVDVNGNYEPSNCRWITNAEQQKNKRNSKPKES